jgi:predicted nucleic acid-binding protein
VYTIDASVWVNGFDQREAGHDVSRRLLDLISVRALPLVLPNLVLAEVAGAVSRSRNNPAHGEALAASIAGLTNAQLVPLDDVLAKQAVILAANHALRGADAGYGAVALQAGATLITLDNEQLSRMPSAVPTTTPTAALTMLSTPAPP